MKVRESFICAAKVKIELHITTPHAYAMLTEMCLLSFKWDVTITIVIITVSKCKLKIRILGCSFSELRCSNAEKY